MATSDEEISVNFDELIRWKSKNTIDPKIEEDNSAVIVMGPSGSSKSALVAYLMGAQLKPVKSKRRKIQLNLPQKYPKIANTIEDSTREVSVYQTRKDKQNLYLIDTVCFLSQKTVKQQLMEISIFSELSRSSTKVKIILTLDSLSIEANTGQNIIKIIEDFRNFFIKFPEMQYSFAIAVTKVQLSSQQFDEIEYFQAENYYYQQILKAINDNRRVPETEKQSLSNFLKISKEQNSLFLFPQPFGLKKETKKYIFSSIEKIQHGYLKQNGSDVLPKGLGQKIIQQISIVEDKIENLTQNLGKLLNQWITKRKQEDEEEDLKTDKQKILKVLNSFKNKQEQFKQKFRLLTKRFGIDENQEIEDEYFSLIKKVQFLDSFCGDSSNEINEQFIWKIEGILSTQLTSITKILRNKKRSSQLEISRMSRTSRNIDSLLVQKFH